MQIPTPSVASETLLALGAYHLAAVGESPETASLAASFRPAQDELARRRDERVRADEALVPRRVALRFSEHGLEKLVRRVALRAHDEDGTKAGGPALNALFPDGVEAVTRPRGPAQLKAATALRTRLDTKPAAAAVKAAVLAELDAAIAAFGGALEARDGAYKALGIARAMEEAARETWVAAYDGAAGAIRTLFPRERARQDLYFLVYRPTKPARDGSEPVEVEEMVEG